MLMTTLVALALAAIYGAHKAALAALYSEMVFKGIILCTVFFVTWVILKRIGRRWFNA